MGAKTMSGVMMVNLGRLEAILEKNSYYDNFKTQLTKARFGSWVGRVNLC